MGIIHILDDRVANQIAAGEVIERPSSAVKELIENALDAHATNISIEIENGGIDLIKITDDGDGFYKDDLPLAIKRHATSKISNFNDVYRLQTFGFRGEALASIAVISRLKITSGRSDSEPATVLTSDAAGKEALSVAAPRKGSCIEVRDLYYNVPARKKFVKTNNHESALIYDLVCKFALGFPAVNFSYYNNQTLLFSSNQLNTSAEVFRYVYGESTHAEVMHLTPFEFYQKQRVEAWFFPITETKKNRNDMIYFVNGRLIESRELDAIVDEAVYTLIPKGRFPICLLKLEVPAFNIDVNIHPTKKLIKFKNIDEWKSSLATYIKEELWLSRLNVPFSLDTEKPAPKAVEPSAQPQTLSFEPQEVAYEREEAPQIDATDDMTAAPDSRVGVAEPAVAYQPTPSAHVVPLVFDAEDEMPQATDAGPAVQTPTDGLKQQDLSHLEYIGQLNQTFILAQDRDNLYIIDQHTLHERILYEKFMKEFDARKITQQPLLHPIAIKLSPIQEEVLVRHILTLRELGFTIESKAPLQFELSAVPTVLCGQNDLPTLLLDMLDDLSEGSPLVGLSTVNEEKIIMASCKAAVKAHYKLTGSEVQYLLAQLAALDNAHTCPHGRPIIMNISMNELYLFFKRGSF
ncbi:MAG: DNA mismatch repair endonuclease MutL [Peptococcaceae bacterium]|nr:DNA mismatch repair endonuclease MutL [Peptococcaceae bacterium]